MVKEKKKNIHEGHRKRLKESVEKDIELDALSDVEVLEYLMMFFVPQKDTNPIAHDLLDQFGSIYGVLNANSNELFQVKDMTQKAAQLFPKLFAIVRRAELSRVKKNVLLQRTDDAIAYLKPYFLNRNAERLYMLSIDTNDRVMQSDLISVGVSNYTVLDFNKIVAIASRNQPSKVILAHNHPSGSLMPSNDDLSSTKSISMILTSIGVRLVDHIIFTTDGCYSFYDNDLMLDMMRSSDHILGTDLYREARVRKDSGLYVSEPASNRTSKTGETTASIGGQVAGAEKSMPDLSNAPGSKPACIKYFGVDGSLLKKKDKPL